MMNWATGRRLHSLFTTTAAIVIAISGPVAAEEHTTAATPQYHATRVAPKGAPNVLLIMTDDVGFAAASTFGGPIPTPTFDQVANTGARYNAFHTTALC